MNRTIAKHDLITAENIMRYLQARRYELEDEIAELRSKVIQSDSEMWYLEARLHEVHELFVHVEGDLDSMIKEMMDQ